MIHGWLIGMKQFDWICTGCSAAWIAPTSNRVGVWMMISDRHKKQETNK